MKPAVRVFVLCHAGNEKEQSCVGALGRIVSRAHDLGGASFDRAYAYDDFDRLASDGGVSYAYDAAGNRMTRTGDGETVAYTLGQGDRLAAWTGGAYGHDAAGCVTRITRGADTWNLAWNGQYQLVSVSTNGVFAESYQYDALGRRVSTTNAGGTTRHVYDDSWQVVADLDQDGNVVRSYVWGEGIDKLLAVKVGMRVYTALTDIQGTVWGYVDELGAVVARWTYDAWGNVLSEEIADPAAELRAVRYRFQGREWSAATGLTNFRMRWYDPVTGRWLSKDPIGLSGGLNLYAFCGDNPINSIDPIGLCDDDDDGWLDILHKGLDIIGTFDPTPSSDGLNAIIYGIEGDFNNAIISLCGIIPYFGDAAKIGKYGAKAYKGVKASEKTAKDMARQIERDLGKKARREFHDAKKGPGDRSLSELKSDAEMIYRQHGKQPPNLDEVRYV